MFKQPLHGIPMLRIFRAILELNRQKKLATSTRIATEVKYNHDVKNLLYDYWNWGYLNKKPIKSTNNRNRRVDCCTWHWVLNKRGIRKYQQLIERFGDQPSQSVELFISKLME